VRRRTPGNRASFDAFEAVLASAAVEDEFEAAAPVLAGIALRRMVSNPASLSAAARQRSVAAIARAMQAAAPRLGANGVRAIPRLLARGLMRQTTPDRAMSQSIAAHAARLERRPDIVAGFAKATRRMRGGS
jgi:hypothetical protein